MGVETLGFSFATPKRHLLVRNRVVWRILCQNRCTHLGCSLSQVPKNSWVTLCREARNHACAEPKPQTDLDEILHGGRYPRHSYLQKFWWPSVKGFLWGGGSNFTLSHRLSSSPLQHSRTTVRACDCTFRTLLKPTAFKVGDSVIS